MCWSPISLKNDQPAIVGGHLVNKHTVVPCGKCLECLQRKRTDWSIRLAYEERNCKKAWFITLTYNDWNVPITANGNLTLDKKELQKYFKRVWMASRYRVEKQWCSDLKYFAVGEYGSDTERPHYHAAVFNVHEDILNDCWSLYGDKIGNVKFGQVEPASIHYLTKYIVNEETYSPHLDADKPFRIMSKGLGNGLQDVVGNYCVNLQSTVIAVNGGSKAVLPRYIVDKIFTKAQKFEIAENAIKAKDAKKQVDFYKEYEHRKYLMELAKQTSKSKIY